MREELKILVDEFYSHRNVVTDHSVIQARELRSIQNAIKSEAAKRELTDEEWMEVAGIILIDDEWWVTG